MKGWVHSAKQEARFCFVLVERKGGEALRFFDVIALLLLLLLLTNPLFMLQTDASDKK